ncbi:MAG: hypothetical protein KIT84_08500 [Labilithrix sp.]|nr:hypothetical protein [Labilithrix sp.]MCW5811038.1 hypothetical protein [Labilithrix sp.]
MLLDVTPLLVVELLLAPASASAPEDEVDDEADEDVLLGGVGVLSSEHALVVMPTPRTTTV